ncbi:MAG: H-NS histone family protein [Candidatus Accumulibacter sp.]|jgi:DNA-binding protein H-NS|nr:H-NS histone family protein [Accumulibacter sp.]
MKSYQSLLDEISNEISMLQKKVLLLRENEKKRAVEMRKLIELYDVQSAEPFSGTKPSTAGKKPSTGSPAGRKSSVVDKPVVNKRAKRVLYPKYQDPETGKTWNGHGKRPFWLIGDRDQYLIDKPEGSAGDAVKAKKKTQTKTRGRPRKDKTIAEAAGVRRRRKASLPPDSSEMNDSTVTIVSSAD